MKKCPKCLQTFNDNVEVCDCGYIFVKSKKQLLSTDFKSTLTRILIQSSFIGLISVFMIRIILGNIFEADNDAASVYLVMYSIPFIIIMIINLNEKMLFIVTTVVSIIVLEALYFFNLITFGLAFNYFEFVIIYIPVIGINIFFVVIVLFFWFDKRKRG